MTRRDRRVIRGIALGGLFCVSPVAEAQIPCSQVQSREFSDNPDVNALGALDPGQTLFFNCDEGLVYTDTVRDYDAELDGLGVRQDALFTEAVENEVDLIVSMENNPNIYFERPGGERGLWERDVARVDVDALEVWGDSLSDAYSSPGDPTGDSIISLSILFPEAITQSQILEALQSLEVGLDLFSLDIDVDGFMRQNIGSNRLLFSIAPVGPFDGGEIFVMDVDTLTATYLDHGGHLWDTDFDVMGAFDVDNENINAIEAIPEPCTSLLVAIGALVLLRHRRLARTG